MRCRPHATRDVALAVLRGVARGPQHDPTRLAQPDRMVALQDHEVRGAGPSGRPSGRPAPAL